MDQDKRDSFDLVSEIRQGTQKEARELLSSLITSYSHKWSQKSEGYILLRDVIENKRKDIAKLLLAYDIKVNIDNTEANTPLHFAAVSGDLEIAEMLLDKGADINAKGKEIICRPIAERRNDYTSLHLAADCGEEKMVKLLLSRGANINSKTEEELTALHLATLWGNEEIIDVLLKCGAGINSKDKYGRTALDIATRKCYPGIVEILLKFGADIDSKNIYGRTALHIASKYGNIKIVKILLEHGSDINVKYKNNVTPFDYVIQKCIKFHYDRFHNVYDKINLITNWDDHDSDNDDDDHNYYDDRYSSCFRFKEIIKILKFHMIKMKNANLYISEENLLSIECEKKIAKIYECSISIKKLDDELNDFENKCKDEIRRMKSERVNNENVSFHDILTKDINQLARKCRKYAGNVNIAHVLRLDDYKIKYPIYGSMISSRFRKGERRRELLQQSNKIFYFFQINFKLPQECTDKIFSYVSNEDLGILTGTS